MNRQLLVDYLPFEVSPAQITESMKENNGKLVVTGILQRAESKNQNGRIYPKDTLVREAKKYITNFIREIKQCEYFNPSDAAVSRVIDG